MVCYHQNIGLMAFGPTKGRFRYPSVQRL